MSKKEKTVKSITEGQRLWFVGCYPQRSTRATVEAFEVVVTSVGRKFAEITGVNERIYFKDKIDVVTLQAVEDNRGISSGQAWVSKEAHAAHAAKEKAWSDFSGKVSSARHRAPAGVTLETIQLCNKLLYPALSEDEKLGGQ